MDDVVVKDDAVEFHWTFVGTNTGPGGTGKRVRFSGFEEWTLGDDGLVAGHRVTSTRPSTTVSSNTVGQSPSRSCCTRLASGQETADAGVAYARFPEPTPTRYRDGWLPSS